MHAIDLRDSRAAVAPSVRVVPRNALAYQADGPTRGYAHIGWPDHPADAPGHLDFGPLLLFARGRLLPGEGVPMHRHANIENLVVVRSGRVRHADDHGGADVLRAGDVSLLSAGGGIAHAESVEGDEEVDALVIWLRPDVLDTAPRFHVRRESRPEPRGFTVLASGRPARPRGALPLGVDAALLTARLHAGSRLTHAVEAGRRAYLVALGGRIDVEGHGAASGDRVQVQGPGIFSIAAVDAVDLYLLDLP